MGSQRKALIIATDKYENSGLPNLLAPAADAESLGRVLGDPQIGNFNVQVVRNQPAHVIQTQIEDLFAESRPDDVLLLHFSGHGLKSESGALFFAASNTRPNRLRATAVSADFVRECMRDCRSRSIVVLLDCCYGGAFAQGVTVRSSGNLNVLDSFPGEKSGGRGRAVITASSAMEYAFEGNEVTLHGSPRPSVFTAALVEGLATGDADHDGDGWVSLNELYDYVFDKVRDQNPHQTPSRQVELEGELYLARSRRLRIRATPIPADLQAALADSNMYARRGAIAELRSRLFSENLPAAAGAYEALAEVVRSDVQFVADAARAALREIVVAVDQPELNFGQVQPGSRPPHRTVQLLGPPLARACVSRPSHNWIHVIETASGLDISIDTSRTGTLHGNISLKGPIGETAISVDVNLVSPSFHPEESRRASEEAYQWNPPSTTHPSRIQTPPSADRRSIPTSSSVSRNQPQYQTDERSARRNGTHPNPRSKPVADTAAATTMYPPVSRRFRFLLIYLLPVIPPVVGTLLWLIMIPFFTPNRIMRMNIIQSVAIYFTLALPITFSIMAGNRAGTPSAASLHTLAYIGYIFSAGLLLFCVICVIKRKQPRIPLLTKAAYRIVYGRPGERPTASA